MVVQNITIYYNRFGFDLIKGIITSSVQIASVINFGIFIAFIITTANLLKEKVSVSNLFRFGLVISLVFGVLVFLLSNTLVPKLRMTSFLNVYENARSEKLSTEERIYKTKVFKEMNVNMMSIKLINKYSDSLENENTSQRKIIKNLFQKIPDSIIKNVFSKKKLTEYNVLKNNLISDFNQIDLYKLNNEIRKNEYLTKKLKKSYWKKSERYIYGFYSIFFVCFGIVIGTNFKNKSLFLKVIFGIIIYSLNLSLLTSMSDYFVKGISLIELIIKITIILIVFLYLVYKMLINKNTGANTV
mgnify:CR=1 FL=1